MNRRHGGTYAYDQIDQARTELGHPLVLDSMSMRGAQREITGELLNDGYEPVGRWQVESDDSAMSAAETVRRFKLAAPTKEGERP